MYSTHTSRRVNPSRPLPILLAGLLFLTANWESHALSCGYYNPQIDTLSPGTVQVSKRWWPDRQDYEPRVLTEKKFLDSLVAKYRQSPFLAVARIDSAITTQVSRYRDATGRVISLEITLPATSDSILIDGIWFRSKGGCFEPEPIRSGENAITITPNPSFPTGTPKEWPEPSCHKRQIVFFSLQHRIRGFSEEKNVMVAERNHDGWPWFERDYAQLAGETFIVSAIGNLRPEVDFDFAPSNGCTFYASGYQVRDGRIYSEDSYPGLSIPLETYLMSVGDKTLAITPKRATRPEHGIDFAPGMLPIRTIDGRARRTLSQQPLWSRPMR